MGEGGVKPGRAVANVLVGAFILATTGVLYMGFCAWRGERQIINDIREHGGV